MDVGSCGLSRDGSQQASYGILEWKDKHWQGTIRRITYDIEIVIQQIHACGMPYAPFHSNKLQEALYD